MVLNIIMNLLFVGHNLPFRFFYDTILGHYFKVVQIYTFEVFFFTSRVPKTSAIL